MSARAKDRSDAIRRSARDDCQLADLRARNEVSGWAIDTGIPCRAAYHPDQFGYAGSYSGHLGNAMAPATIALAGTGAFEARINTLAPSDTVSGYTPVRAYS